MTSTSESEPYVAPRVFVSYSHDSDEHKAWVLQLADRLIRNNVDVILDQYELKLGSDLPAFMEMGLGSSDRVLAVCSSPYVQKANDRKGGVGYERMILTANLMKDLDSNRIIPIVRSNHDQDVVPTFLSTRMYTDFRDPLQYELKYEELLREIHGVPMVARPALGPNPFFDAAGDAIPRVSLAMRPERYVAPALSGRVSFNYDNNSGRFVIGSGETAFTMYWAEAGPGFIYILNDPQDIRSVALAKNESDLGKLGDVSVFDNSSRSRTAQVGDSVILENIHGYYAAASIEQVHTRHSSPTGDHEIIFKYVIQPNRTTLFGNVEG